MTNGRVKGAAFERETAKAFMSALNIDDVKRDLEQYREGDHGDLIGIDGWTIECKRYKHGPINGRDEWWQQAVAAANRTGTHPVLVFKYDRQPVQCRVLLSSIHASYMEKDDTAIVSFETLCMLIREDWAGV
jgi:Holliday junction resolvase